jgi:hypothetical protein
LFVIFSWSNLDYARIRQQIIRPSHDRESFIQTAMNVEVGGEFDPQPIQALCASKEWSDDILITCDHIAGGIGNVRNHILNCIRYAIEFGGNLVVPQITVRNPDDIFNIYTPKRANFSYLLDLQHFKDSLSTACPQMSLYNTLEDFPRHKSLQKKLTLVPRSLQRRLPVTGWEKPEEWHLKFHNWLSNKTSVSPEHPALVGLGRAYLEYPIFSDGVAFAKNFGKLLRFREDTRYLAAATLYSLSEKFALSLDPSDKIPKHGFFGAHLRTEADAVKAFDNRFNNSRYEVQSELFLEQAVASNLPVLYVASGNLTEVARFKADALETYGISVTTKNELLEGEDLEKLQGLAWDQQALVDFQVMLKASSFAGIGHSSFAWNIALIRHLVDGSEGYLEGPQLLSDGLSQIYGVPKSTPQYGTCMWP